jgi:hypothetical protein
LCTFVGRDPPCTPPRLARNSRALPPPIAPKSELSSLVDRFTRSTRVVATNEQLADKRVLHQRDEIPGGASNRLEGALLLFDASDPTIM